MPQLPELKVLLADDHEIFRDGLASMLSMQSNIKVVGSVMNGRDLLEQAELLQPDIILTDIIMPVMDGIAATKMIHTRFPQIQIIALSMFDQDNLIIDMLEAGAKGYLLKNSHKTEILDALYSVYQNIPYYCRSTSTKLVRLISQSKYNPNKLGPATEFSGKEIEIIRLICQEKTSREIADVLHMGNRTVEGYRIKILEKMNVKTSVGVVVYAIKNGLYKLDNV